MDFLDRDFEKQFTKYTNSLEYFLADPDIQDGRQPEFCPVIGVIFKNI